MGVVRFPAWPARYAERAARIRRDEGVWWLSSRILHRLISPVIDWGGITFFERTLDALVQPSLTAQTDIDVREVTAAEMDAIEAGIDPNQPPDEIARRFRRGDRAFAAIDEDGTGAHTRWVTTLRACIPEIEREVVLGPRQAYFYNGYTRPDRRGRGVDGFVRNLIFTRLQSEGYTAAYSYVRRDNPVGFRAASRWQRPVGTVWYLRIGRSRPFVIGAGQSALPALVRTERADRAGSGREQAWRRWFQGWTAEPLSKRSTGCHALPEAYFQSAAAFIASILQPTSSDDVLDVGCDSAMIGRLIAPRCRRFAGVDFITEMLQDARARVMSPETGSRAWFIAADGRSLPIRSGAFHKVYCSAVLHTLPSRADGWAVIDELIRVTADGGTLLVSSIPDRAKRFANRAQIWQRASWNDKLTLPFRWALPASVRRRARRVLRAPASGPPEFLDYDLREIRRSLQARGMTCAVRDFPLEYWNSDFRKTRSNLVITVRRSHCAPASAGSSGCDPGACEGPRGSKSHALHRSGGTMLESIDTVERFAQLRDQWDGLLSRSASNCIFLTHEWLFTWWTHLADNRRLSILTARQDGRLVGIMPLVDRAPQVGRTMPRALEFLGSGLIGSDYLDIIVNPGCEGEVLRLFADRLRGSTRMLQLSQLRRGSAMAERFADDLRRHRWNVTNTMIEVCPFIDLRGHTWGSYLATLSSNHRYNFNRRLRQLMGNFDVSLECVRTPEDSRRALDVLIHLHERRWGRRGESEAFQDASTVAFHRDFVPRAADRGWLRVMILSLGGMPAAALYGFRYGSTFSFYQSGFDPAYSRQSVGLVLMGLAIKAAIEEGASEFDFLHGPEDYKFHWTRHFRELGRLELYPPGVRGRMYKGAVDVNRSARRMARRALSQSSTHTTSSNWPAHAPPDRSTR